MHVAITRRLQESLRSNGTRLHQVIDQSALLRSVAPAEVMAAQLDHLCTVANRPFVTVQITALRRHLPVLGQPFTVLSYSDSADPGVAASYGPGDWVIISTDDNDVHAMQATFTTLADAALPPVDSLSMISEHLGKLR